MSTSFWVGLFLLASLALFLYGFWSLIPVLAGLPWRGTASHRIRKALKMANLQPGEMLYDLGSGDGRVLVLAAREFRARGVGIEISLLQCLSSRFFAWINGVGGQVNIRQGDFYTANLGDAQVVFAYMTSRQIPRLRPHLEEQLRPGARVVTISFDLDGWEPSEVDRDELIFLYQLPAKPGSLGTFLDKKYNSEMI